MTGPCLCGDPYCPSCGNPQAARLEAAEEWAIDQLHAELLTEDEYRLAIEVGLVAVRQHRQIVQKLADERAAVEAEANACQARGNCKSCGGTGGSYPEGCTDCDGTGDVPPKE